MAQHPQVAVRSRLDGFSRIGSASAQPPVCTQIANPIRNELVSYLPTIWYHFRIYLWVTTRSDVVFLIHVDPKMLSC